MPLKTCPRSSLNLASYSVSQICSAVLRRMLSSSLGSTRPDWAVVKSKAAHSSLQGIAAVAMAFPEPVAAFGCAQKTGGAAGGGEHGPDDIVPDMGGHAGGFVEDDEVETVSAQFVGVMGAADGDDAALWQVDAALGFVDDDVFEVLDDAHEAAPGLGPPSGNWVRPTSSACARGVLPSGCR